MNEILEFSFPFPPYNIQKDFMIALFDALEGKKLGIFESPTGTGKSLSIICGALTWLEQHSAAYKAILEEVLEENIVEDTNDWFNSATKRIEKENEKRKSKKELVRIEKTEKRIEALKLCKKDVKRKFHGQTNPWVNSTHVKKDVSSYNSENPAPSPEGHEDLSSPEQDFLLDDYASDGEEDSSQIYSEEEDEDHGCLKIFYCSRTHSQLAQFVKEVHKTRFQHDSRVVSLGSRSNLCINEAVSRLPFPSMINEKCLELQEKKSSSHMEAGDQSAKRRKISAGCPYNKQIKVANLADQALVEVQDIEQLVSAGRKSQACPYYASRKSVRDAQLVVVPYQCLLHHGTREACGIHLEGNVVIVDEAHNLLETLSNIHSASLSLPQVCIAEGQLSEYLRRYEKRLSPKNLLYIRQIMFIIKAYKRFILGAMKVEAQASRRDNCGSSLIINLQDFLLETLTDNLSLIKLVHYMQKSNIAHKVDRFKKFIEGEIKINPVKMTSTGGSTASFLAKMAPTKSSPKAKGENQSEGLKQTPSAAELLSKEVDDGETSSGCPLLSLIEFLKTITHGSSDGRIVVSPSKDAKLAFLKYLVLNPAAHFHDIVRQCRSVIVAGGTMAPVDEFKNQLFLSAGATPDRIVAFSCSHVVAAENILPLVLTKGPGGKLMDFTLKNRNNSALLDDLGRALSNLCNVVPGGIVLFLPSYAFEEVVYSYLEKTSVIRRILAKKKVFREPKKSSNLEKVLAEYCSAISTPNSGGQTGSVLFSVVGGKMSEGINFSDAFGRCIIMVGVPYPNAASPELKEKMDYLNKNFPASDGKSAGTTYYENLCFKAVNQSIGRSIRHRNDYASILLVDHRYSLASSQSRLPSWISPHLKVCHQFGPAFATVRKFFLEKKQGKSSSTDSSSTTS